MYKYTQDLNLKITPNVYICVCNLEEQFHTPNVYISLCNLEEQHKNIKTLTYSPFEEFSKSKQMGTYKNCGLVF